MAAKKIQIHSNYLIFALILIFFGAYSLLSIGKHLRFETSADLGIYAQSVWHYSRFEIPYSSLKNVNQLGDHFNPSLAFFAPLYWLWPNVTVLLLAQSLFVALGALPIYWFAKDKLGELAGIVLSFAYLFFVGIQSGVDFNFHPEVVAATSIALAVYFAFKEKVSWYFLFLFLSLGLKEDIAPIFAGFALYLLVIKKSFKLGGITLLISLLWFYSTTSILMPYFQGEDFEIFSVTPKASALISGLILNPPSILTTFLLPAKKLETMLVLLGSFAFVPLASALSYFTVPFTLINRFVSGDWSRWSTHFQYSATVAPLLAFSAIIGIENLRKIFKKTDSQKIKAFLILAVFLGTIWINRPGWDPPFITPPLSQILRRSFWTLSPYHMQSHKIISEIPKKASVATNTFYVPHLVNRDKIFEFPRTYGETVDFYLISTFDHYPFETREEFEEKAGEIRSNKSYQLISEKNGILLFKLKSEKI